MDSDLPAQPDDYAAPVTLDAGSLYHLKYARAQHEFAAALLHEAFGPGAPCAGVAQAGDDVIRDGLPLLIEAFARLRAAADRSGRIAANPRGTKWRGLKG